MNTSNVTLLCIVAARSGSKRLPNKNIQKVGGVTLIERAIKAGLNQPNIADVLLTTDSKEMANIGASLGALVPWLRPKKLSGPNAASADVCIHALNWYEKNIKKVDGIVLLQPTSPFRTKDDIGQAVKLYKKRQADYLISVTRAQKNADDLLLLVRNKLTEIPYKKFQPNCHSKEIYKLNGSIYIISKKFLCKYGFERTKNALPYIIDEINGFDIDTEFDLMIANMLSENLSI